MQNSQEDEPCYRNVLKNKNDNDVCPDCNNKYANCMEKKKGVYMVKAVKRHVSKNLGTVLPNECYDVYSLFYNILIDNELHESNKEMLDNLNMCPPMCMRKGSLHHCLKWTKWRNDTLKQP